MMIAFDKIFKAVPMVAILVFGLQATSSYADEQGEILALIQNREFDDALAKINKMLMRHPNETQWRFFKGMALAGQGRAAEAIDVYTRLTVDHPDLAEPFNNLAVLYASSAQYENAIIALNQALRISPGYAMARENLGDLYLEMARATYEKTVQMPVRGDTVVSKLQAVRAQLSPAAERKQPAPGRFAPAPVRIEQPFVEQPLVAAPQTTDFSAAKIGGVTRLDEKSAGLRRERMVAAYQKAAQSTPHGEMAFARNDVHAQPVGKDNARVKMDNPAPLTAAPIARPIRIEAGVMAPRTISDSPTDAREVANAINAWANSWSSRNITSYLASYGKDFTSEERESRGVWESKRRARLSKVVNIEVKVEGLQVAVRGSEAIANFRQRYISSDSVSNEDKILVLSKSTGKWLIKQEIRKSSLKHIPTRRAPYLR